MHTISIDEAKANFNEILSQVETAGDEVVITRQGLPVVRVSAVQKELKPLPFEKLAAQRNRLPKMQTPSVEFIRQMRDEKY